MHIRTVKLANFSAGCIYGPPLSRGGDGNGKRARVEGRRREGKEKVRGMTEGRKVWEIGMGDVRHCC